MTLADFDQSCTPKNEVRGRDVRCLISGGEDYLLLGRDKVAHILPHSQPFLVSFEITEGADIPVR